MKSKALTNPLPDRAAESQVETFDVKLGDV